MRTVAARRIPRLHQRLASDSCRFFVPFCPHFPFRTKTAIFSALSGQAGFPHRRMTATGLVLALLSQSRSATDSLMNRTPTPRKLPVTIISGFLGAGKTTLVNQLLQQRAPGSIGVVVNEFGEVGIDGQLIVAEERALVEINNGCVCCTVRADLVSSVKALLARPRTGAEPMQRLIVETSGLADPAPVLQTFLADPDLREAVDLESVVTVVDALHLRRQLDDDIAREQVAFADVILINKLDLITEGELIAIERTIRSLNPTAALITSTRSQLRADALLGMRRFSFLWARAHNHEYGVVKKMSRCLLMTLYCLSG
ncbi:CobW family GTP-binding protein [Paraburkholderia fungorum]|uniref:CobW family GTP-binding protein n=1 Tax=Paraburkholderia fungorum TaxID=134537 RepID=UPI0038BC4329